MDAPTTADGPPAAPRGFLRRHLGKILLVAVPIVLGGVLALYTMAALSFSYSKGERVGFVQKLSRKGWVCRTWEGELAMNPVPGSPPQMFAFTVPDQAVAKRISESEGKRVALSYEEKKGVPSKCFGETSYFVRAVRVLGR